MQDLDQYYQSRAKGLSKSRKVIMIEENIKESPAPLFRIAGKDNAKDVPQLKQPPFSKSLMVKKDHFNDIYSEINFANRF